MFPFHETTVFSLKLFHLYIFEQHPQEGRQYPTEYGKGRVIKQVYGNSCCCSFLLHYTAEKVPSLCAFP